MVQKAIDIAKETGMKAIRLDVLGGNIPAERLYQGFGFRYMATLKMYYEDTGWTDFKLYEYVLSQIQLNKIAARWPAKAVAQFSLTTNKSSGSTFRNSVLLSYHTKQLNTESSTAYEKNSIYRRLPQSEL